MKPLRILHVCTSDKIGGAARAAHRLHLAQREAGLDSHMLVLRRSETSPFVHAPLGKFAQLSHRLKLALAERIMDLQKTPTNQVFHSANIFDSGLGKWINDSDFDIVNLHWLGAEMLSIKEIARIRQPIVWTMHDMWPFSGSEHYDDLDNPERYVHGYSKNTRPKGYSGLDIDAAVWRLKKRAWSDKHFHLVSPSNWLADCAKRSALFKNQPCSVIPNCIDTKIFKPIDKQQARLILNLTPEKKYILFGAISSTTDKRKGFHLLQDALKQLSKLDDIRSQTELLIFGSTAPTHPIDLGLHANYLGHYHDDISLALLYSAADVFVAPSMQDNLPNTLVEAIACGTQCIGFDVGGIRDLIKPILNGQLVQPYECTQLQKSIKHLLKNTLKSEEIRNESLTLYSEKIITEKYINLYKSIYDHETQQK
ncbi:MULTISPECIES: glycosyltransferase [unclassified Limnobacter]|uniref:glycosyltransferase n=1 Tax=unclassified Limnobacter TaxID=2630203 RepID=UPI000C46EB27|nr:MULTISPECIES: glycosyltransferase [unclassified Limnobacter]MAG79419.1 glycosyl transferase [Sutterellaceae bacterium]MBT84240.1 glycosyl transferase [Sutterellaceae bacterium]|tara:strand:- start:32296 stop:33567 length:1272 start_codon:yes stop_codon:yes gene_type:complete